ncbi:hypothetical protein Hanom_Chr01g00077011 [Helianthus anomalus]
MSTQPKTSSIFTPSVSSSQRTSHPHPLAVGILKKADARLKIQEQPTFSKSKDQIMDPMISNSDIYHLITQAKQRIDEQVETNKTIFREIEGIKKVKIPADEGTPLIPKMLNFNSPGFSNAQHQGSSTMFSSGSSILQDRGFTNNFSAGFNVSQHAGSTILNPSVSAGLYID